MPGSGCVWAGCRRSLNSRHRKSRHRGRSRHSSGAGHRRCSWGIKKTSRRCRLGYRVWMIYCWSEGLVQQRETVTDCLSTILVRWRWPRELSGVTGEAFAISGSPTVIVPNQGRVKCHPVCLEVAKTTMESMCCSSSLIWRRVKILCPPTSAIL